MAVQVGSPAPEFTMQAVHDKGQFKDVKLSDYKGKWVVVFFYPLDFTFVCPTEITSFRDKLSEFTKLNAVVIGASVDSVHSHKAWLKELGELGFPLASDISRWACVGGPGGGGRESQIWRTRSGGQECEAAP